MPPRFVRLSELTPAAINREMQLHTCYTDGTPTVREVIRRAEELGLEEIAFTEHVRAASAWFPRFAQEVRREAAGSAVRALVGAEVRITDFNGTLDIAPAQRRECDLVLASVHRFPAPDGGLWAFDDVPREEFAEIEYRLALGFTRRGGADVLAHPGGMSQRHLGAFPDDYVLSLTAACEGSGVAFEINTSYLRDVPGFIALLRQSDPRVSIGSDAHTLDELGRCRDTLKAVLWPA